MITITHEEVEQEILTVGDGMTWSGSKDQGPRTLSFEFLYKPINEDIPKYNIAVGDKVVWEENKIVLFQGYIESLDYITDNNTISVTCKDLMARLMRSKFIGRMRGTLNQLAQQICSSFDLQSGINVDSTLIHNIASNGDLTYYQVLGLICEAVFGKKPYQLYLDGITLKLAEHNIQEVFEIGKNIRTASFKQDASALVTKVLIIDNNSNVLNSIQDDKLLDKFGLFQETYNYNKDSKTNYADASKVLSDSLKRTGTITGNNNNNCITGRFIKIKSLFNNMEGTFEIQSDTHTIGVDGSMILQVELKE